MVSIQEKSPDLRWKMSVEKMSESEPSMTYRKGSEMLSKAGSPVHLRQVREEPVYCADGSRYIGGMISTQASARNVRTCPTMPRESCKRKDSARATTNASGRGGAARSSEEAPVMGVERRGCVIPSVSDRSTSDGRN